LMWVIGSIFYLVPLASIAVHLSRLNLVVPPPARLRQGSIAVPRPYRRFDLLSVAPCRPSFALALRPDGGTEHRLRSCDPGDRGRLPRSTDGGDEHGLRLALDLRPGFGVIALLVLGNIFCLSRAPSCCRGKLGHRPRPGPLQSGRAGCAPSGWRSRC